MSEARTTSETNDEGLFRAVDSGSDTGVVQLSQNFDTNLKPFSDHAINWALVRACQSGRAFLAHFLLQEGFTLETRDEAGNTPLLICSEKGMGDTVRMLLAKGADVNAVNDKGDSALILARSPEVVELLLSHPCIEVTHQNTDGYTALMAAIEAWNLDKVKLLVNLRSYPVNHDSECFHFDEMREINFFLESKKGEDAFQIAHRVGLGKLVELLYQSHRENKHPLLKAAVLGDLESCNLLFQYKLIDCEEVVEIRTNVLSVVLKVIKYDSLTVGHTETDLVRRLCETGVDVNACSGVKSPLDIVIDIGSYDLAEILCQHGAAIPHKTIVSAVEKNSNINFITLFANYGAEMNQSDESGSFKYPDSAMDIALRNSDIDCAKVLLCLGAKIDVDHVLTQAVDNGNCLMLKFLMDRCKTELHDILENKSELFNKAALLGKVDILQLLLEAGTSDKANEGTKIDVDYVLTQAVDSGNCVMFKLLMVRCKTELRDTLESKPELFIKSVSLGNTDIVQLLLEAGADVNGVQSNKTPLMNAVHPDVIRCLLQNGADINKKTTTTTLINAISHSYFENIMRAHKIKLYCDEFLERVKDILRLLIENGANVEAADDEGNTVLIESVRTMCHGEIVQMLLDKGSDVHTRNNSGQTALLVVTSALSPYYHNYYLDSKQGRRAVSFTLFRYRELVRILLENNAHVNVEDCNGNTPLLQATVQNPHKTADVVDRLIALGADVNHVNNSGMSALMLAAARNVDTDAHSMSVLLRSGCDVNIVSTTRHPRRTALSILLNKWCPKERSLFSASKLLDHGATAKYVRPDVLHRLTAMNKRRLVHKLIVAGLGPSDVVLKKKLTEWPINTISPLGVCLLRNNIPLAKYFIDNWYLTQSDVKLLSGDKTVLENVEPRTSQFLRETSAQPMRLEMLSFITVSSSIGSGPDREERIKKSLLPNLVKQHLLFKNVSEMSIGYGYENYDDGISIDAQIFIMRLTKSQLLAEDVDPEFLYKDVKFVAEDVPDDSRGSTRFRSPRFEGNCEFQ